MMSVTTSNQGPNQASDVNYRVVVFGVPPDPVTLQQLIASIPDTDHFTAVKLVKNLPGVLPQVFARQAAARLATSIRQLGLHAAALPAGDVPDLSHARQSHHLRLTRDVLEIVDAENGPQQISWNSIHLLSVGVVPSSAPSHFHPSPGLSDSSSHRSWNSGVHFAARPRLEAFVVTDQNEHGYRFASDEMNYEYLAERLSMSSHTNFDQLIREMINYLPHSAITSTTQAFAEHSPKSHLQFHTQDDFRRYTEFQVLLTRQHRRLGIH